MHNEDLDDLRRRMIVGGAAVTGLVYWLLLQTEMKSAPRGYLLGLIVFGLVVMLRGLL